MNYTHQEIRLIGGEFYSSNRYASLPKYRVVYRADSKQLFNDGGDEPANDFVLQRVDHEILIKKLGSIFLQLKQFNQWVCWKYVERDGKQTKPPINPHNGSYANHSDPSTWGTWREAYNSYKRNGYQGIGFVFTASDPFTGIDIDDCLDSDGQMLPIAQDIVTKLNSYTEISPSGKGVKIWVVGTVPEGRKVQLGDSCSIEFYSKERYFTITGKHWPIKTPHVAMDARNALMEIYNSVTAPKQPPPAGLLDRFHLSAEMVTMANTTPVAPHRSQDDFRLIVALVGRGATDSEIKEIFGSYPIGKGKYATNGEKYLQTSIKNARDKHRGSINPPNNTTPKPNGKLADPQPIERIEPTANINPKSPQTKDFLAGFKACNFTFRLNDLDDTIEVNNQPMTNVLKSVILSRMRDIGLPQRDWVKDAMIFSANQDRYHPVQELLNGLQWDGKDYIGEFVGYLTESTGMAHTAFKRWLIGAVAKVFEQAQNFMFVWDGPQGVGKSTLARWLCPWQKYFIEGAIKPENKDSFLRLIRFLVWEVGELQAVTRKADKEALKDFITRQQVIERPSYGEFDIIKPAMASLIGTINEDGSGFLTDPTGNRRFVVIHLANIDFSYQRLNPVNLWAQAIALYRQGERWELTPEEKARQREINSQYEVESPLTTFFFENYYVDPASTRFETVVSILNTLETAGLKGSQDMNAKELARLMKRLGAVPARDPRRGSGRSRGYRGVVALDNEVPA